MKALSHALTLAVLIGTASTAHAVDPFLWYNGDFDEFGGLYNVSGGIENNGYVYDDFIVPMGQTWTITGLHTDLLTDPNNFIQANWQIRSGISMNNGGTLVASGTSETSLTPAAVFFNLNQLLMEINVAITLTSGTYWLNVAPIDNMNNGFTFIGTTLGANAIGTPTGNNGNSFWTLPHLGFDFESIDSIFGGTMDFSYGVRGFVSTPVPVPEPGSVALLVGMASVGSMLLRRRKK